MDKVTGRPRVAADPVHVWRGLLAFDAEDSDDSLEIVDAAELDDDLSLGPADVHLHPRVEAIGQPLRELGHGPWYGGLPSTRGCRPTRVAGAGDLYELLGGSHRQALGDDPAGERLLFVRVVESEQRARVARGQH